MALSFPYFSLFVRLNVMSFSLISSLHSAILLLLCFSSLFSFIAGMMPAIIQSVSHLSLSTWTSILHIHQSISLNSIHLFRLSFPCPITHFLPFCCLYLNFLFHFHPSFDLLYHHYPHYHLSCINLSLTISTSVASTICILPFVEFCSFRLHLFNQWVVIHLFFF